MPWLPEAQLRRRRQEGDFIIDGGNFHFESGYPKPNRRHTADQMIAGAVGWRKTQPTIDKLRGTTKRNPGVKK